MNLDDISVAPLEKILIFSDPNLGKTYAIGQLAAKFHLHWFDLENGIKTLLQPTFPKEIRKNVTVYRIPDDATNPIAIETMLKIIQKRPVKICEAHGKVGCPVCIKSGGAMQDFDLSKLGPTDVLVIDGLNQLQQSAMASITKMRDDLYKPDWEDFRNQGALMGKILSVLQNGLNCHVAVTSHPIEVEMEDGSKKLVPISGTTNFSRNTAKYFDHIVYINLVGPKRKFTSLATTNPKISAGSRYSIDLSKDAEPSLLKLFQDVDYAAMATQVPVQQAKAEATLDSINKVAPIATNSKPAVPPSIGKSVMNLSTMLGQKA